MLHLIGTGLNAPRSLTLEALEAAKRCTTVYAESYTNVAQPDAAALSAALGVPVHPLARADLEDRAQKLIAAAKAADIAVLVPGDPLAATTHAALLLAARAAGVPVRLIHNASVFSAIAETGLQLYKFGATVTLASPWKGFAPLGWYDACAANQQAGLHTLILLDSGTGGAPMTVPQAIALLESVEAKKKQGLFAASTKLVVASQLGTERATIAYDTIKSLTAKRFGLPAALALPGKLHFAEEEFLAGLSAPARP